MRAANTHRSRPLAAGADMRKTALYAEVEELYRTIYKPGSGRVVGASEPSVSPDGQLIALTGVMLEKLEGAPTTRICLLDRSAGLRVATFGPNIDCSPAFSPDGCTVAFRSDRGRPGDFQLYLLDATTGETRAASTVEGWVEYFAFSPDGLRILFGVAGHGADVAGAQGAKSSRRDDEGAAWMPEVETGDEEFRRRSAWVLDVASGAVRKASPAALNVWEACWSGNDAIAAVVTSGAAEEDWYRAVVVRFDLEGGSTQTLFEPEDQLGSLSGAPDGRRLAVVEAVCSDRSVCAGALRLIDIESGETRRVDTAKVDVTHTVWRDSTRLLIAGVRNFESVVADVDVASSMLTERWRSEKLMPGVFYPHVTPDPQSTAFLIVAAGADAMPTVLRVENGEQQQLFAFGHSGTDALRSRIGAVEPYRWKAPDGSEIQGWLMRGRGNGPAPLVMEVHGGPIWRWAPPCLLRSPYHILLAERGYALFWPNPRGSTGRGQDFARAVVGDMGGADTYDYLSGLDRLAADGVADPRRIAVMGGSYGGFMTSWLITQDQRFAAAISVAPVTDWTSQHLTSNIPYFDTVCLGSKFTDQGGNHYLRSPVLHAHRVKTPTLNICGALDRCTPPGQAREFHNALRESGAMSVLISYPQEGHGVRSFPAMIDYAARVVSWIDAYLGGAGE